jgi:hypothetical protein
LALRLIPAQNTITSSLGQTVNKKFSVYWLKILNLFLFLKVKQVIDPAEDLSTLKWPKIEKKKKSSKVKKFLKAWKV